MLITDIKTHIVNLDFRNAVFLEIETDTGITGIAETVMKRRTLTVEQSILELKRFLIGRDPTEIEDIWEKMYRDSFWVGGPLHATAISAVDCALWDILARSLGVPVYKLLGGPTRRSVPVYCHCPSGSTPEEFAENVSAAMRRGYRAIKTTLPLFYGHKKGRGASEHAASYSGTNGSIGPCVKETEYLPPDIFDRVREFVVAAREAGGAGLGIAIDCHGRLGVKAAIKLCRRLEDLNLLFIEEPIPPENAEALARVQRSTSVPIAAGERWATIYGAREFIERGAIDILQCDLVNCGGISGLKKIAALAEAHYIGLAPHNPNGPVATAMNLHFAASIPNYFMLETIGSEADERIFREIVSAPPTACEGEMKVPGGPGFGLGLIPSAFSRYPYHPHEGWR